MNLKALVLGASLVASSCASSRAVCEQMGESLSCTQEIKGIIITYDDNFYIGKDKEKYCALTVRTEFFSERTHYVDYGCNGTVDMMLYESASEEWSAGTFTVEYRSSFKDSYDPFFRRKRAELLDGEK